MRRLPIALATALIALAAGCGGGENTSANQSTEPDVTTGTGATTGGGGGGGDITAGQLIWVQEGCNSCHTIDGMPATDLEGPNFDRTKPDHDTVVDAVTNGKGSMQEYSDTLSPADIQNVAAYVVDVARGS